MCTESCSAFQDWDSLVRRSLVGSVTVASMLEQLNAPLSQGYGRRSVPGSGCSSKACSLTFSPSLSPALARKETTALCVLTLHKMREPKPVLDCSDFCIHCGLHWLWGLELEHLEPGSQQHMWAPTI